MGRGSSSLLCAPQAGALARRAFSSVHIAGPLPGKDQLAGLGLDVLTYMLIELRNRVETIKMRLIQMRSKVCLFATAAYPS